MADVARDAASGRLLAVGSGLCFGTVGLFSKLFYSHGGHSFELVTIRMAGAVLFLAALLAVTSRSIPRRAFPLAALALALGVFQAATNYALLEGYSRAPAALIVLLYYIYPLVVSVLAVFLFDEELGRRKFFAIAVGVGGIALTVGAPSAAPVAGIILGLVAGMSTAGFVLGARHVMSFGTLSPVQTVTLMLVGPAVGFTATAAVRGFAMPSGQASLDALGLVVIGTVMAPLLFFSAVPKVGAGTTSLLATVEPFVTVLLAFAVLHESLSVLQICGGALILVAVTALSIPAGQRLVPRAATVAPLPLDAAVPMVTQDD
jgi:drug/metabolite transporter (DMT)-like permease